MHGELALPHDSPLYVHPFGEADCESEIRNLQGDYEKYYFDNTPFNGRVMDREVFLIIGRRGCGKTALGQYFSFQKRLRGATTIDVDEPHLFQTVLARLAGTAAHAKEVAVPRLASIWEFVIWILIFRELQHEDARIGAACVFGDEPGKASSFVKHAIKSLIGKFLDTDDVLADELENLIACETIRVAKEAVIEVARRRPIIISFDTLENYQVHDETMMRATAALVECASRFNRDYSIKNIHFKLFMMAEIFPHLVENVIGNSLKHVRDEVYMHWRPKDLMRLISWRLYHYLKQYEPNYIPKTGINWDDYKMVKRLMWDPFFGEEIVNGIGLPERTFPYVLRHTQLRPRQLIVLCNSIANAARSNGRFPVMKASDITQGIRNVEKKLASEVYNSFSSIYPNVGHIAEALSGVPVLFQGSELDKRAPSTASEWANGGYSALRFRQLVAELGLVGRVRKKNYTAGYVAADFEYASEDRLTLLPGHQCTIHPMFYEKLRIKVSPPVRVYPFPDHPDFEEFDYE